MNGTQAVDRALSGASACDDLAWPLHPDRRGQATATLQKEAAHLRTRADFLDDLAALLSKAPSILSPKAYDSLMQFVVDASR